MHVQAFGDDFDVLIHSLGGERCIPLQAVRFGFFYYLHSAYLP